MDAWLLTDDVAQKLEAARQTFVPTPEQRAEFTRTLTATGDVPRSLTVKDGVATLSVKGVLTKAPDIIAALFGIGGGNTTYASLLNGIAYAEASSDVRELVQDIDSPGGEVDGLFDVIAALQAFSKPKSTRASNALSAAYGLATNGGRIEAKSKASAFGSVGTAVTLKVEPNVVTLTNTDSPDKRPDVTTAEGKKVIVDYLDAVNQLFVEAIAQGRGNATPEKVSVEFGRGAVLLASEALSRGMIDSVAGKTAKQTASAASGGLKTKETRMTLEELRAQHPEAYQAAVALGMTQGVNQERDRVTAHCILAEASGDQKSALEAIASGTTMSEAIRSKHTAFAMKKNMVAARQEESDQAGQATNGAQASASSKSLVDYAADAYCGKEA